MKIIDGAKNALGWSEKYTKTDMTYLFKGNFWLLLGRIISTATGMALTIAFANLLPKEAFGTYKYILSVAGFLGAFTLSGMGTSITRSVAMGDSGIVHKGFIASLKWSTIASGLSLIASLYYFIQGNSLLGISLVIIAIATPILAGTGLSKSFLHGKKDFRRLSLYAIPRNLFSVGVMIGTVFLTDNILIIISAYFLANIIGSSLLYIYTLKQYDTSKPATTTEETTTYAKHLSVTGFLNQMAIQLDQVLLWHFAGPVQLAIYAFALSPARELRTLTENIFPLALPKFAEKNIEDVKRTLPLRTLQMFIVVSIIVVLYILAAPLIYKLIFPQYLESVFYSQLFALTLLLQPKGFVATTILAHAKVAKNYILTFAQSGSRIILFLILLPLYGIMGGIIAILASEIISAIVLWRMFKKL